MDGVPSARMSTPSPNPQIIRPTLDGPTAVRATVLLFCYNGLVIGAWAASLPGLRERLGLDSTSISVLLVALGVCAIVGMQVGGRCSDAFGARRVSLFAVPLLVLGMAIAGAAGSYWLLVVAAMLLGLGNGCIDVSMNAIGVQVERHRSTPIMSFFHGMWSVGNLAGAVAVLLAAVLVPTYAVALATGMSAALGVLAFAVLIRITPATEVVRHVGESGRKTPVPLWAWLLGVMAIAFGLGEGTAMDWSGIHVTDVAGIPAVQGSIAVTVVAAFMVLIRLIGDRLTGRFGRRAVVRFGGVCSAAGYFVVSFATPLPVLLIGWALVGLGIGMIAPQVYAVAGHAGGGRGLAIVVTFGYATFLCGPAVIGFFVNLLGIQKAMLLPAVLLCALPFLAKVMPEQLAPDGGSS